jgi:hypothetical protein
MFELPRDRPQPGKTGRVKKPQICRKIPQLSPKTPASFRASKAFSKAGQNAAASSYKYSICDRTAPSRLDVNSIKLTPPPPTDYPGPICPPRGRLSGKPSAAFNPTR